MSDFNSDLPFEPLIAPRIAKPDAKPIPVDWFERIAPRMAPQPHPESYTNLGSGDPEEARLACFADMSLIADEEKRIRGGLSEDPKLVRMRENAIEEARQIVKDALEQAKTITIETEKAAYHAGFQRGYAEGERAATENANQLAAVERDALRADMTDLLALVEQARRQAWAEIEPQAIDLIFALCKQVIKQEIEVSRTVAIEVIRNAVRRVSDQGALRVRVHPEDLENVRSNRGALEALLDGNTQIEIVADRRIGQGGCIVETESGSIDARIETQITNIGETLQQVSLTHREEFSTQSTQS